MPVYEFKCSKCGTVNEEFFKTHDVRTIPCSVCGFESERIVSKIFTHASLHSGGHNGMRFAPQSGIFYDSYPDFERKAAKRGLTVVDSPIIRASASQAVQNDRENAERIRRSSDAGGFISNRVRNMIGSKKIDDRPIDVIVGCPNES